MENYQIILTSLIGFIASFILLKKDFAFLPKDQGKALVEGGQESKGKTRGVGLVFIIVYIIGFLILNKFDEKALLFSALLFVTMLTGYLDDASDVPWEDYKKGILDFIIAIIYVYFFIKWNSTTIYFFSSELILNPIIFGILAVILIWASINVVNCSDGIDGLATSLFIVSAASYLLIFPGQLGDYVGNTILLIACLLAYLWFNVQPSTQLMGDAGSRALGFFLAALALKSQHPISFLILALVFIVDGGLGLIKIFLKRFFKVSVLKNTRTPIHDELRSVKPKRGWSNTQIIQRFLIVQIVIATLFYLLIISL